MDFKIIWTKRALSRLESIVIYLKDNWSIQVQNEFSQLLKNKLQLLSMFPNMGIKFSNRDYRKLLLTEHSYLQYRIKDDRIILMTIRDTRQDTK